MTSQYQSTEATRVKRMLRTLKAGDRVLARINSTRQGEIGTVLDPEPFSSDGIRRIKVRFDSGTINVLPSSIEVIA